MVFINPDVDAIFIGLPVVLLPAFHQNNFFKDKCLGLRDGQSLQHHKQISA